MIVSESRTALAETLNSVREKRQRLALVPTMGYLHEGHLSLVDLAKEHSDFLAASIFVNPLQFGPDEDLDQYPRDLDRDLNLLRDRGVDLVFAPAVEEMYPHGPPVVTVDPGPMSNRLCGGYRTGHFRGVLTVVARLFGLVQPELAVFGQKDYQQAVLIRRMVRDLELGVEVLLGPIIREEDGLAMSSRNVYLTPKERADAAGLRRGLLRAQEAFSRGIGSSEALLGLLRETISAHSRLSLQYAEMVDPDSLEPLDQAFPGAVVALAAFCGRTRLIDNHILEA